MKTKYIYIYNDDDDDDNNNNNNNTPTNKQTKHGAVVIDVIITCFRW